MKIFDPGLKTFLTVECQRELAALGRDWEWLAYLKKHKTKYEFLNKKGDQFDMLQRVLEKAIKKFKFHKPGEISELLSEIVSQTPPA